MQRISLGQALSAMPHVSPLAWRSSSLLVRWLVSARASVLVMTFGSAALGGLLAAMMPGWDPLAWTVCLIGLLLAHGANNQLNDLTDSVRGIDEGNYFRVRYGAHVLEDGLLSTGQLWKYIGVTGGLAALAGIWLVARVGPALLMPFISGSLLLLFYTWPLKQWGWGEVAVLLVWGPLMVGGTFQAATGHWDWQVAAIGLVYALGPTAVIFGKHIDKIHFDRDKGIGTLPVRLGLERSRIWVRVMLIGQYLTTAILILLGWIPWPVAIVALAVPKALAAYRVFDRAAPEAKPDDYPDSVWPLWYVAFAFDHTRWFCLLFVAGLSMGLFQAEAAETVASEMEASATKAPVAGWERPNIVVILVDDAGYMDFGGYGGEARTPHIDSLANNGIRFSNYHSSPLCAPSRAMLLTGLDNHLTGVATIPEVLQADQRDQPGYTMHLEEGVQTVADRLRSSGYRTYMTGKWHLGSRPEDLPDAHGFDRSFALDASGADNFEQKPYMPYYDSAPWFEDGQPATLPEDFYSSEFLVDRMIDYLETDAGAAHGRPFFAYLAFQAIHIPIQVPREFTDRYDGVYDQGWEALRQLRWQRARALGLIPDSAPLADMHPALRGWGELDPDEQKLYARSMAVNAGMLEAMDHHVGRFLDYLRSTGQFANTLFLITSDNGPEFNNPLSNPTMRWWMRGNGYSHELETLGEKGSMAFIGPEWASAASSPGSLFKFYAAEGGLRVPLIVAGPGVGALGIVPALSFVTDLTPTILDFAEALPAEAGAFTGRSLRDVLDSTTVAVYQPEDAVGLEVSGNAALFKGGYKLVKNTLPHGDGQWRLFFLAEDPGETRDLSSVLPDRFEALKADYAAYAERMGVVALPADFNPLEMMLGNVLRRQWEFYGTTITVIGLLLLGLLGYLLLRRRKR